MKSFKNTKIACYLGFFTQAIVINLAPLLFVSFQNSLGLSYEELGRLIFINFGVQICTDVVCVRLSGRLPLRAQLIAAHAMCAAGLCGLVVFPTLFSPYIGLVVAVVIYSVGGGLIEVLLNPVVSEIPDTNTKVEIPLLHSFYCWGHVCVCLISTLCLHFFQNSANIIPIAWASVPIIALVMFFKVPLPKIAPSEKNVSLGKIVTAKGFAVAMVVMVCSGAAEQTIAQWVSFFAEKGLQMPKLAGDLFGMCAFALCMAVCRTLYGVFGERINLKKVLFASAYLCVVSYALICFVNNGVVSLIACALCGISVALMWPGTVAAAGEDFPKGGAAMFALLSVMGDIGCSVGPWIAGAVSDAAIKHTETLSQAVFFANMGAEQIALKCGIACSIFFPLVMALCLFKRKRK